MIPGAMRTDNSLHHWVVIGASRGLGRAVVEQILAQDSGREVAVLGISRRPLKLSIESKPLPESLAWQLADVSSEEGREAIFARLKEFNPGRIVCAVGGGPFGPFSKPAWRDHLWALEVTLLFPLRLIHWALSSGTVRQVVLVGSSVAESDPDPGAVSYAAAKHGLLGALRSLVEEVPQSALDLRLLSPGYMDTDLVPRGATVRSRDLWRPDDVAKVLVNWALEPEGAWHHRLARFPDGL